MNLKKLDKAIKNILSESVKDINDSRVEKICTQLGEQNFIKELIKRIDSHKLSEMLDQIEVEFDSINEEKSPEKGSPGWHQLQIAKKTLDMNDVGAAIMGGMTKDEAKKVVEKYGKKTNKKNLDEIEIEKPETQNNNENECTIIKNSMGHLLIWKGKHKPLQVSKYNFTVDGKESDLYIQNQADVESLLENLPPEEKEGVENGYTVITKNIPSEYFGY